jgi:hypothetical protein
MSGVELMSHEDLGVIINFLFIVFAYVWGLANGHDLSVADYLNDPIQFEKDAKRK